MDRIRLDDKRRRVAVLLGEAPTEVVARFARSFDVEYAHNSTAIEGNTLSLIQTKVILEDGLSVGGKALREIYEVANHDRAFSYVKRAVAEGRLAYYEALEAYAVGGDLAPFAEMVAALEEARLDEYLAAFA